VTSTHRRPVRLSHLTFSKALKRMLVGSFSTADLCEATGLSRAAAYELTRALRGEQLVRTAAEKGVDSTGRRSIQRFELVVTR
jgi:hypothetical protein